MKLIREEIESVKYLVETTKSGIFIVSCIESEGVTEISSAINLRSHPPSLIFWKNNQIKNKSMLIN